MRFRFAITAFVLALILPGLTPITAKAESVYVYNKFKTYEDFLSSLFTPNRPTCSGKKCPIANIIPNSSTLSKCQINDQTANNGMPEGFPRPTGALVNKSVYKILIIPVSFSDLPFTQNSLTDLKKRFDFTSSAFKLFSYGASRLSYVIPDKKDWLSIPEGVQDFYNKLGSGSDPRTQAGNNEDLMNQYFLNMVDANVSLRGYDTIWIISSQSDKFSSGAEEPWRSYTTKDGAIDHVFSVLGGQSYGGEFHGLGHMLFYFDDEYQYQNWIDPWSTRGSPLVGIDIYGRGNDLIGWNRWLNGWLSDSKVACLDPDNSDGTFRLTYLNSSESGMMMLLIPVGPSTVIAADYQADYAHGNAGLLLYKVDLTIPQWQIRFRGENKVLRVSQSSALDGYVFKVLATDKTGIYVSLKRN